MTRSPMWLKLLVTARESSLHRDGQGAHFGYTFGEATGTFEFGDPAYPAMKGAIIVKQGDSVVGGSPLISSSTT